MSAIVFRRCVWCRPAHILGSYLDPDADMDVYTDTICGARARAIREEAAAAMEKNAETRPREGKQETRPREGKQRR